MVVWAGNVSLLATGGIVIDFCDPLTFRLCGTTDCGCVSILGLHPWEDTVCLATELKLDTTRKSEYPLVI